MSSIDELSENQPYWLQSLLRDGPNSVPLLAVDPSFVAFIERVRANPEKFPLKTFNALVSGFGVVPENYSAPQRMLGPAVPQDSQTSTAGTPQETEVFASDVVTDTPQGRSRSAGMLGRPYVSEEEATTRATMGKVIDRAINNPTEVAYAARLEGQPNVPEFDAIASEYKNLQSAEALSELFFDPTKDQFQNITQMMAYIRDQANQWNEFVEKPSGQAYLAENPDLPKQLVFTPDIAGLLTDLTFEGEQFSLFGKTQYSWRELAEVFQSPVFEAKHIAHINDLMSAAGIYDGTGLGEPNDWTNKTDTQFLNAWMYVNSQAIARNISVPQYLREQLNGRIQQIDRAFAEFDDTNLATSIDRLSLATIGRRLTASEYGDIKSQIELFGSSAEELLEGGGDPLGQLEDYQNIGLDDATKVKLTNVFNNRFKSEAQRYRRFVNSRDFLQETVDIAKGRSVQRDTALGVPDVVAQSEMSVE